MDNGQMSPIQPIQPAQPMTGTVVQSAPVMSAPKNTGGLVKTIVIIILALVAVTFIGLFIWMMMQYNEVQSDIQGQINVAVADAKMEQATELEAEFAEREKDPYTDFAGPADYGQLSFKYPKTWSVYVAKDAANGGDYEAYFNPRVVEEVSKDTINALRLTIRDKTFDDVAAEYQKVLERKDSGLSVQTVDVNGITMNRYIGKIPNTELNGIIVIFKIRDKTAVMETDSMQFENDFYNILNTVQFNA